MSGNFFKTLGEYVSEVFDKDKNGVVTFKEILTVFPNNAVAIAFLVVDLLVLVAEYRVLDVAMRITNNDIYKSIGFVLVSAIPFYLSQILWLYPNASTIQRVIAVVMGAIALYTSAVFGLADLSLTYDVNKIVSMVVNLTVFYIVILLLYVLVDSGIRAKRMEAEARAKAAHQRKVNEITRSILADLRKSLAEENALRDEFGEDAVREQIERLRGVKNKKQQPPQRPQNQQQMMVTHAFDTPLKPENPTQPPNRQQ
jgi:hypothetical protein